MNKRILHLGERCFGLRICDCLLDLTLVGLENIESLNDLWRFYEKENGLRIKDLFWTYHDECFIGCCKTHINYLYETNSDLVEYRNNLCENRRAVFSQKHCFDMGKGMYLEMYNFCHTCLNNLSDVLVKSLNSFSFDDFI